MGAGSRGLRRRDFTHPGNAKIRTLTALVSPGYAPYEQYDSSRGGESKQGPWTNIYGLGATLRKQQIFTHFMELGTALIEEKNFAEAEKEKKSKYGQLVSVAEQAINAKDRNLAITSFNQALALYPGDAIASSGIPRAERLKHRFCYEIMGEWVWPGFGGGSMIRNEDATGRLVER